MDRFPGFDIKGKRFRGRKLWDQAHGAHADLGLEGEQGGSETYLIYEPDAEAFATAVFGNVQDLGNKDQYGVNAHRHPQFPKLAAVGVYFTPFSPPEKRVREPGVVGSSAGGDFVGPDGVVGDSSGADFSGDAVAQGDGIESSDYGDGNPIADNPSDINAIPPSYTSAKRHTYGLLLAEVRFGEQIGWVERGRGSLKTAEVDAKVAASGGSLGYTPKLLIPFPEFCLSLMNRRVLDKNFKPFKYAANFGTINDADWTLPSGLVIPAECAQYLTCEWSEAKHAYGPRFREVTHHFLMQPWSWNKTPHRDTGDASPSALKDLKRAGGSGTSALFKTSKFGDTFDFRYQVS